MMLSFIRYGKIHVSICRANISVVPSKSLGAMLTIDMYSKAISMLFAVQ